MKATKDINILGVTFKVKTVAKFPNAVDACLTVYLSIKAMYSGYFYIYGAGSGKTYIGYVSISSTVVFDYSGYYGSGVYSLRWWQNWPSLDQPGRHPEEQGPLQM